MAEEINQGMTRREVLKKGAIFGGTLMWVAPAVQIVGMSPAMAQIPSENSCCLKLISLVAAPTDSPSEDGDDIEVAITVQNCGTQTTDYDILVELQRLPVFDGVPDESQAVSFTDQSIGDLLAAQDNGGLDTYNDANITDAVPAGFYIYRGHGTYECPERGGPRLHHNGDYWEYSNVVEVVVPPV